MSIRRCPDCWNLVERDSISCAVCGRSYFHALINRLVKVLVPVTAIGSLVYLFVGHRVW